MNIVIEKVERAMDASSILYRNSKDFCSTHHILYLFIVFLMEFSFVKKQTKHLNAISILLINPITKNNWMASNSAFFQRERRDTRTP